MVGVINRVGQWFNNSCEGAGYTLNLFFRAAVRLPRIGQKRSETIHHMIVCVLGSMPVVFITALFTGMIVSLQTGMVLRDWGQESTLGVIVAVSMCREMGPVFTALTIAGLVGSTYAAELGTMKVSEEVDALEVMSIDPIYYLVMPRIVSLAVAGVVLTIFADLIGIIGGAFVAKASFNVDLAIFFNNARDALKMVDVYGGLLKSAIFAATIGTVACSQGLRAGHGAAGVGHATLRAVVVSFICIVVFDYLISWGLNLVS